MAIIIPGGENPFEKITPGKLIIVHRKNIAFGKKITNDCYPGENTYPAFDLYPIEGGS